MMSLAVWRVNESLQILNEAWKLWNFDVALDHIARVEVSNSLDELLEGFLILFLFIKIVSVFLADLSNDFFGERS